VKKVVITGIGLVTPLGLDAETVWSNVLNGVSGIAIISSFDASQSQTQMAGEVKNFDPLTKIDRKRASHMDRVSHLACYAALEAVDNAKLDVTKIKDSYRAAVMVGSGIGGFQSLGKTFMILYGGDDFRKQSRKISPYTVPMLTIDSVSANISIMFGFHGVGLGIASACATGGDSLSQAAMTIQTDQADVILAGGSEASVHMLALSAFNACRAMSTRNDEAETASRPFDKTRDGFVMGEGACVLVLESEEHAKERGANILCELAGYSSTSDAYHETHPLPSGAGAIEAMKRSLAMAKASPQDVDYINAHGTSTQMNDLAETRAIKTVFGKRAYDIPVSSTKSMNGHLIGATGAAEVAFCALAMRDGVAPPTINLNNPDPECDLDYVPNKARKHRTDIAISNSFGFGGHNSCITLKRADS